VERWFWEVWNEPNIGYWQGTPEDFLKLHDYAVDAVRRALPTAKVGGADTAGSGGQFTRRFLEHCLRGTNYVSGRVGTPLDFVSFHAKGAPSYVAGHVRMGIAQQLRTVREGFQIIGSFPELKNKPVVIGECDPEGCAACQGAALAYRNGTMYSSYTAASFARLHDLAESSDINLEGALTWAFEFEGQAYFAGFRSLASNGLDKPVLNVFRLFGKMTGRRLEVDSDGAVPLDQLLTQGVRERPDISALASLDEKELCILLWHYHDDDVPGPDAAVELVVDHLPAWAGPVRVRHFQIDGDHSNAYTAWLHLGSPQHPTPEQYAELQRAGQLSEITPTPLIQVNQGKATLHLVLPRQAVSLLQLASR
jgi:xylan 1,4-beta-xylosidase